MGLLMKVRGIYLSSLQNSHFPLFFISLPNSPLPKFLSPTPITTPVLLGMAFGRPKPPPPPIEHQLEFITNPENPAKPYGDHEP